MTEHGQGYIPSRPRHVPTVGHSGRSHIHPMYFGSN
jgi:hypothetical protein